jgi:signal transduction histidine kinase
VVLTRADALSRLDQLQVLVDQLVALAHADAADSITTMPVDLDELVLGQARQLARHSHLRVDTSRVSGGQVAGRDTDLARLVENLATNAARYASTTVSFAVHQFGDTVELIVDDDGPGVAPADRERIFERFRTLDDARTHPGSGAGLGLAIVDAIATAHDGMIRVGDAPGGGARFEVHLPAFRPPPLARESSPATERILPRP